MTPRDLGKAFTGGQDTMTKDINTAHTPGDGPVMNLTAPVTPNQADREAAAGYVAIAFGGSYRTSVLKEGRWPDLVEAFARHRIASQAELVEALKPFAAVADFYDLESEPDDFNLCADLGHRHITAVMKLGLYRRARAALAKVTPTSGDAP